MTIALGAGGDVFSVGGICTDINPLLVCGLPTPQDWMTLEPFISHLDVAAGIAPEDVRIAVAALLFENIKGHPGQRALYGHLRVVRPNPMRLRVGTRRWDDGRVERTAPRITWGGLAGRVTEMRVMVMSAVEETKETRGRFIVSRRH